MTARVGAGPLPVEDERARAAAEAVLDQRGADGIEVVVIASDTGVTRYAASEIIQNIERHEVRAFIKAVVGNRVATATTNQLDKELMRDAARMAVEAATRSLPDPDWTGLATPAEVGRAEGIWRWDETTAATSPLARAASVAEVVGIAGDDAAGVFETSAHAYGIYSSTGISCFDAHTRCVVTCLVTKDGATGWAEGSSFRHEQVDVESVAQRAADKAHRGSPIAEVEPGAYPVVLEAPAASVLLDYLAYAGFGAKQMVEDESFFSTRKDQMVAASNVVVADDAAHDFSIGIGFDFEGVPRRRVDVIRDGVAVGPVTDRRTARQLNTEVTGHGSGSNEFGPYAANVVMEPGSTTSEELPAGIDDGLLVTRFHYVNILDRPATLLTGMTRDGTFRIRNGEVAEPVRNLRFTQSALDALRDTTAVGADMTCFAPEFSSFGSTAAPSLRVSEFNFTSTTTH